MCNRLHLCVWMLVLAAALPGWRAALAQDLTRRAPDQDAPIALVHARVHTIAGGVIEDGYVFFDRGRIERVGPMSEGPAFTATTRIIDLRGRHVSPGLISPWTQMGLGEIGAVRAMRDFAETGAVKPEVVAAVSVNPDSWLMPVARSNGVLAFGVFPQGGLVTGRASVITADGWTWEDLTVRRDAGLVVAWPVVRTIRAPWMDLREEEQARRSQESVQRLRETFRAAAAYLAARDRSLADPSAPAVAEDIRWEAMRGVLAPAEGAERRPVFIEAQEYEQILGAVAFAREFGLRAVIVGGRDAHLCADLLRRHDIPVIINSPLTMPRRDDSPIDEVYALPVRLREAGVRFALASGEETPHERNLPYAAAICVAHGLDHGAALRAITLDAARILGVDDRLGSIEPGKDATLIVTDGDPLEVTTHTLMAFIAGRSIDLSNKQRELADKYREKYRQRPVERGAPGGAPAPR
jgi:imidazolonepropionase-like amidohydrolase